MPIHDWTRIDANLFHDFHQTWTIAIRNALIRSASQVSCMKPQPSISAQLGDQKPPAAWAAIVVGQYAQRRQDP